MLPSCYFFFERFRKKRISIKIFICKKNKNFLQRSVIYRKSVNTTVKFSLFILFQSCFFFTHIFHMWGFWIR